MILAGIAAMVFASSLSAKEVKADDILGVYVTDGGKSNVEIYRCGDHYCGKIVWLKEPLNDKGEPKVDGENPDASLKGRPIMGMKFLWGFKFDGDDMWEKGNIYDPENGKTYDCQMSLDGNKLNVRGYILGMSFLGRTTVWTRKS